MDRLLLWPGGILLGMHGVFMMQFNPESPDLNGLTRFLVAASIVPTLAQAFLIAGLIALVLEQHGDPDA